MPAVSAMDRIRARAVRNCQKRINEHLEAMQRDAHGLEFAPWLAEVDGLWKSIFGNINLMSVGPQKEALESIRELWTTYITHYGVR